MKTIVAALIKYAALGLILIAFATFVVVGVCTLLRPLLNHAPVAILPLSLLATVGAAILMAKGLRFFWGLSRKRITTQPKAK
jgi:uncharacterized membrane protein YbhN (UPF0104 family)